MRGRPGLLRAKVATLGAPRPAAEATEVAMGRLFNSPLTAPSAWKERMEWARMLSHGTPDIHGRRVGDESVRQKCRYVARLAWRAVKRGEVPTEGNQRTRFRNALLAIYEELDR